MTSKDETPLCVPLGIALALGRSPSSSADPLASKPRSRALPRNWIEVIIVFTAKVKLPSKIQASHFFEELNWLNLNPRRKADTGTVLFWSTRFRNNCDLLPRTLPNQSPASQLYLGFCHTAVSTVLTTAEHPHAVRHHAIISWSTVRRKSSKLTSPAAVPAWFWLTSSQQSQAPWRELHDADGSLKQPKIARGVVTSCP